MEENRERPGIRPCRACRPGHPVHSSRLTRSPGATAGPRSLILCLTFILGLTSCGSDRLSSAEYFPAVEQLAVDFRTELERLEAEFDTQVAAVDFDSPNAVDVLIGLFQRQLIETSVAFETFHTGLGLLAPPEDVEPAHDDAVAAAIRVSAVFAERRPALDALGSLPELDEFATDPAFGNARDRFTESCIELEALAEADGIAIDLPC